MKKYFPIVLGVIGLGLVGYSVSQGWASFTQSTQYGMGFAIEPVAGYKYWQGLVAGIGAVLAFGLLFLKPKLSILPALLVVGASLLIYLSPPMVEEVQYEPQKAILMAVAGGALLALAGLFKRA
jgi:hypothetical protein